MALDYREMLRKYINHVGEMEGVTFVNHICGPEWTPEEIAEMQKLDQE